MMMMMMLALVAAVLARRGGAPGARVAAAAVDVGVVAVAATRVADAAGARRELTADAAALGAVAAGRAGATPPGASAGVLPRPAANDVPRARAWSILSTVACGVGLEGVHESANESVEGPRGKGTIDEARVRRGRDRVFARDGARTARASATKSINRHTRRGGFATREKKRGGGGQKVAPSPVIIGTHRSSCSRSSARPGRFCHRPTPCRPPSGPSSPPWSIPRPPSSPIDRLVVTFVRNFWVTAPSRLKEPPFATVGAALRGTDASRRCANERASWRSLGSERSLGAAGPRSATWCSLGVVWTDWNNECLELVWIRAARGAYQRESSSRVSRFESRKFWSGGAEDGFGVGGAHTPTARGRMPSPRRGEMPPTIYESPDRCVRRRVAFHRRSRRGSALNISSIFIPPAAPVLFRDLRIRARADTPLTSMSPASPHPTAAMPRRIAGSPHSPYSTRGSRC